MFKIANGPARPEVNKATALKLQIKIRLCVYAEPSSDELKGAMVHSPVARVEPCTLESSEQSILWPQVRIPSTTSTLFSICIFVI